MVVVVSHNDFCTICIVFKRIDQTIILWWDRNGEMLKTLLGNLYVIMVCYFNLFKCSAPGEK